MAFLGKSSGKRSNLFLVLNEDALLAKGRERKREKGTRLSSVFNRDFASINQFVRFSN